MKDGEKVKKPEGLDLSRSGYVFIGWSNNVSKEINYDTIVSPVYAYADAVFDVTYVVRAIDPGKLSFNHKTVSINEPLGDLPELILSEEEIKNGWRLDKIYLNNSLYTVDDLKLATVTKDSIVEYRMIQDVIEDNQLP